MEQILTGCLPLYGETGATNNHLTLEGNEPWQQTDTTEGEIAVEVEGADHENSTDHKGNCTCYIISRERDAGNVPEGRTPEGHEVTV